MFTRQISAIKLNPREKSTCSQFAKLNPHKILFFFFFSIFRISETYIFTLGSLSINDDHVKNILQDIKQYISESFYYIYSF